MSTAFAFLHHLASFVLVAALAAEMVLLKGAELTVQGARRVARIDALYGASAGILLIVGFVRVLYFEKGAAYYLHSAPFIAKLALFIAVGLLSIYPTVAFRRWSRGAAATQASLRKVRTVVHLQLAGVVLILLCAAMMARGVGYFG